MRGVSYFRFLTKLTVGKFGGLFKESRYNIKRSYKHRTTYNYDDDRTFTDEYQKEVYELAKYCLNENGYTKVIDIGCGSAFKLLKYFHDQDTIGMDVSPTYEFLTEKFPDRKWIHTLNSETLPSDCDIIVCADVIEHVLEPEKILELISKIKFKYLFLSTPERDMLHGIQHFGPPSNPAHVREWNYREFYDFVSKYFKISSHQITHVGQTTQLLICELLINV